MPHPNEPKPKEEKSAWNGVKILSTSMLIGGGGAMALTAVTGLPLAATSLVIAGVLGYIK